MHEDTHLNLVSKRINATFIVASLLNSDVMFFAGSIVNACPLSSQEFIRGNVSCGPALISRAQLSFRQRTPRLGLKTLELTHGDIKLALESCFFAA